MSNPPPVDTLGRADDLARSGLDVRHPRAGASTIRRVIHGALLLLSTQPITWACSLLMTIFIPRLLDSRSFGEYTVAATLTGLLGSVVSVGSSTVLTRRIASTPANAGAEVTTALALTGGLATMVAAVSLAVIPMTGLVAVSTPLLVVAFVGMIVVQEQTVLNAALVGLQRLSRYAWCNALVAVCITVASIVTLNLGGGAVGLVLSEMIPILLIATSAWVGFGIGFDWSDTNRRSFVRLATMGLPFLAWEILIRFRSEGETLFLASMLSVETVGWWNAAMRVVVIPLFVPTLIMTPLMPALSQLVDDHAAFAATLRRSFDLMLIITVGASAAIFAFAPIVPTILGWAPEYQAAVPLMQTLVMFFPLASISMVFGTGLMALGDERRLLLANFMATALQYLLLVAAVPFAAAWNGNGALGAAFSRVASEFVMLVAAQVLLPPGTVTFRTWLFAGRVLLAGAVLVAASLPLLHVAWPLAALAGGFAYLATLLLMRAVRLSDLLPTLDWIKASIARRQEDT